MEGVNEARTESMGSVPSGTEHTEGTISGETNDRGVIWQQMKRE